MIVLLKRLLAWWRKPIFVHAAEPIVVEHKRCIGCLAMTPALLLTNGLCGECSWKAWKAEADQRMRSLSIRGPVTDWDVAQAFEKREPEAGRIDYRFLGMTGEEEA